MANPPKLQPSNWGKDETKFLTFTKVGREHPFVFDGESSQGEFWIYRVDLEGGASDAEFGTERSFFPKEYLHDLFLKLNAERRFQVGTKLAVTKVSKQGSNAISWAVEFAGEQPQPSGASVTSKPPATPPPARQQQSPPPSTAAFDPYRFPARDKFASPVYTKAQAEEIARWAVRLADTVAAPGSIEKIEDSRIVINTSERRWNDERARQSNIATWVILAKDIVPTDFGPSYGPPPDLEISKAQFWNLVKQSGVAFANVGALLIERFEPEGGDGGKLTVWNYLTALADIETIIEEAAATEKTSGEEPDDTRGDPNVDPDPVEDIDEPANLPDAGVTADDIPFGY